MMLAVIIPTYNVGDHIEKVLRRCLDDSPDSCVYVSDGGSKDDTVAIAKRIALEAPNRIHVEVSRHSGRANCLNDGAMRAKKGGAALFFFLHGDTLPSVGFTAEICKVLAKPGVSAGAFRIETVGAQGWCLRLFVLGANWLNNLRSSWMETPYGDQGIFVTRNTFDALGGFPAVPLMEDPGFVWAARRRGIVAIAPLAVQTAAGQWSILGPAFVARNYLLLATWILGLATPHQIFHAYYPGRPVPPTVPYCELKGA